MKQSSLSQILLFFVLLLILSRNQSECQVTTIVKSIGVCDSSLVYEKLKRMEANVDSSVHLLINELKPITTVTRIPPEEYSKYWEEIHIVWCIRALRYLTGQEFTAKTEYIFMTNEKARSTLLYTKDEEVSFFAVRMAHDVIYVAPVDAQKEIIRKWDVWFQANSDSIKLNRSMEFNDWYF